MSWRMTGLVRDRQGRVVLDKDVLLNPEALAAIVAAVGPATDAAPQTQFFDHLGRVCLTDDTLRNEHLLKTLMEEVKNGCYP